MHRSRRTARRRLTLGFALAGSLIGAASEVGAASKTSTIDYGTTGSLGSAPASGPNVVQFVGMDQATATTPTPYMAGQIPATIPADHGSSLDLGRFEVEPPAPGTTTVYDHTPFAITLQVRAVDGGSAGPGQDSVVVRGWLDGSVGGSGSQLMAHYQLAGAYGLPYEPRDDVGNFEAGTVNQTLTIPGFATALSLPAGSDSATELTGVLVGDSPLPSPAPEPGTLLIFVAAGAGLALGFRGRSRARRIGPGRVVASIVRIVTNP